MKKCLSAVAVFLFFYAGYQISKSSVEFSDYANNASPDSFSKSLRDPAAIPRDWDLSGTSGLDFQKRLRQQVLSGSNVIRSEGRLGLELGHFWLSTDSNTRVSACDRYSRVRLTYEGQGTLVSGSKPTMELEGPCTTANDFRKIDPLWIPVQRILASEPNDWDEGTEQRRHITLNNISDAWPREWVLKQVTLFDERDSSKDVFIESKDIETNYPKIYKISFGSPENH